MTKTVLILLFSLFGFSASAQDVVLSFAGTPLKKRNSPYYVTVGMLLKDGRLISETPEFKIASYQIVFLPKGGGVKGPYTMTGQDLPDSIKTFIKETNIDLKIFLADIVIESNIGIYHSKNYSIELSLATDIMLGDINLNRVASIDIDDLISHKSINTFDTTYKLISFELHLLNSDPTSKLQGPIKVNGTELNDEALKMLKDHADCSGKIFIDEITALNKEGKQRKLNSCIVNYHK